MDWSIGFGFERVGLAAARRPWYAIALVAVLAAIALIGATKLKPDDDLSGLFRSRDKVYADYQEVARLFPTSEHDVLVVVSGRRLFTREGLEALRDAHLELELSDALSSVISIVSIREAPGAPGEPPAALFPDELPDGGELDQLLARLEAHPLSRDRLIHRDPDGRGGIAVLVAALEPAYTREQGLSQALRTVRETVTAFTAPVGLTAQLTGTPPMRVEIRDAIRRDRITYNIGGFLAGSIVCLLFFRRLDLVLIGSVAPIIAVLWSMGLAGFAGQPLNTLMNVVPPLVMVIAFCDGMHLVHAIRGNLNRGLETRAAAVQAVRDVGPACVLTSLTTALALLTMAWSGSASIASFGLWAAIATAVTFFATLIIVPALCVLILRGDAAFRQSERSRRRVVIALEAWCARLAKWVRMMPGRIALVSLAVVLVLVVMGFNAKPHYRLSDQVPDSKEAVAATRLLETRLGSVQPVQVMVHAPAGSAVTDPQFQQVLSAVHGVLAAQPGIANVWSLEQVRRWLEADGTARNDTASLAAVLDVLPPNVSQRFVNSEANAAMLTGYMADLTADQSKPIIDRLERALEPLRAAYPGYQMTVSGLPVLAAVSSTTMIRQLTVNIFSSLVLVMGLIGLAFRSLPIMALSLLPNLFPVAASAALLYLTGWGLDYPSVIALIVALGLAVDDSIHFFNHFAIAARGQADMAAVVSATLERVGPVLILTTAVLLVGVAVTLASVLPPMRLFGVMMMTTLAAALAGDMVMLPAIVLATRVRGWLHEPGHAQ